MVDFLALIGEKIKNFFLSLPEKCWNFLKRLPSLFLRFVRFLWRLSPATKGSLVLGLSLIFVFTALFFSVKKVTVSDGETVSVIYTIAKDPEDLIKKSGFEIEAHDEFETVVIGDETNILISRAFSVNISVDGKTKTVHMTGGTVSDALGKALVWVNDEDLISIAKNEVLTEDTNIKVRRVTYSSEVLEESIPYEISSRATPLITTPGRVVVMTAGKDGTKEVTVERKLIDGVEIERQVVSETITSYPTTQISLVGAKKGTPASPLSLPSGVTITSSGAPSSYKAVYQGRGTAYSARSGAIGYSGRTLYLGSVAVDKNKIPMGSLLYVTSSDGSFVYGVAVAADTGSSLISGRNVVDCFFPTYKESLWFGAKNMLVYVL